MRGLFLGRVDGVVQPAAQTRAQPGAARTVRRDVFFLFGSNLGVHLIEGGGWGGGGQGYGGRFAKIVEGPTRSVRGCTNTKFTEKRFAGYVFRKFRDLHNFVIQ